MKKTKGSPLFYLRPDPLRWSIAAALMLQPILALGNGIAPVAGTGGAAIVGEQNGVPVIAIVAPNGHGLSHNQFSDYNVPVQGLVLNNALAPGTSQLAGQLAANPQLNGQAASTILNEVVGQLPSNVLGTQEIFGQAADYVLANPNGIHVQGVGFINTPRAVFLVGTPEIQDGRLTGLNTFDAPGDLRITGAGLSTAAAVDLIAPRIDSHGQLDVGPALNAIAGRNRVAADSLAVVETRQAPGEAPGIDLNALGAMRAGRIRLVSTREGAGIRLAGPQVKGSAGITVDSAGDLIIGRDGDAGRTVISATQGDLALKARQDISITSSRMAARTIRAHAGRDLTLDAATREKLEQQRDAWDKKAWFITTETYSQTSKTTRTRLEGNTLTAAQTAELSAGRDVRLRATDVHADQALKIKGGRDVTVEAGLERTTRHREIHHRKHLWRGDEHERSMEETAIPSSLTAATLSIEAGGKAVIRGSDLATTGDLSIRGQSIEIDAQGQERTSNRDDYRGDLVDGAFSGNRGAREESGTRNRGSNVTASGKVVMVSDNVLIRGSKVDGTQGTVTVGEKDAVIIQSAANVKRVSERRNNTQLGGVLGTKTTHTLVSETPVGSALLTEGDHKITGATLVRIEGSTVTAKGHNQIEAKDKVEVVAGKMTVHEKTTTSTGAFTADAGETRPAEGDNGGSMQYYGKVGYQRENTRRETTRTELQPSVVTAATQRLAAQAVEVVSSEVKSTGGDLDVKAQTLSVISEQDHIQEHTETSKTQGGIKVAGGLERVGSASTGSHEKEIEKTERTQIARATLKSKGDINLKVPGSIYYEGALVEAEGKVNENTTNIRREEVMEVVDTQKTSTKWQGEAGLSVETKDLTGAIRKAIEGKEQARFQQQGVEDAMAPPSLGIDVAGSYVNRSQGERIERPRVTEIHGAQVDTKVEGSLYDKGTRYKASNGQASINAGSHEAPAAHETRVKTDNHTSVDASVRVDTVTGSDVNVSGRANGASQRTLEESATAVPMNLFGKKGVAVQLGTDGRYEGANIDAGDGAFETRVGGDLRLLQAENRQHKEHTATQGYGLVKVGTGPTGKNALLMTALERNTLATTDTQGVGGSIKTAAGSVQAEGNAELQGVSINNGNKATETFNVKAGGTAEMTSTVDTHNAEGQQLGGALQLGVSANPAADAQRKGGAIGGHVDIGRVSEQSQSRKGAALDITDLTMTADAHDATAVRLEGTQLAGESLRLETPNGGISIEAARSVEDKDNLRIAAGAGVNASRGLNKDDDASALYARAKVEVDRADNTTYKNADIRLKTLAVDSAMDTRLDGAAVTANTVTGTVGGDLLVSSVQDQVNSTQVKVDARFGKEKNPQGLLNGLTAITGPLAGKVKEKVGKQVQAVDATITPTLLLDVVNEQRNQVAKVTTLSGREGINLDVAGDTHLTGATLRSGQGKVELGGSDVQLTNLSGRDYRADVSINASTGPAELLSNVVSELTARRGEQAKADEHGNLGVIRTGGHDRQQTIAAGVEERR